MSQDDNALPPLPTHQSEIQVLLGGFESVFPERGPWYLSTPITTGARYIKWRASVKQPREHTTDYVDAHRVNVIEPNLQEAALFATRLRHQGHTVIAPAEFPSIEDWTQSDYQYAWGEVIRQFVSVVVFMDGWAHSNGCSYEFLVAVSNGIRTLSQELADLDPSDGQRQVVAALEEGDRSPRDQRFLASVAAELGTILKTGEHVHQEAADDE
jgi:hypothetical protein